jgi:3-hydroxyisobutyrate dehydrogenase
MPMKIGYIGVGRIGKVMASNLIKANFDLMVYDLRKESAEDMSQMGALVGETPKAVGEYADLVAICVRDDAQVEDVVTGNTGLLQSMRPGSIIMIHSTIHPDTAVKMGEVAGEKGVGVVDAPMSGGREGAAAQTLLYMVGGEEALFDRCRPVLAASGSTIMHMGPLGAGSKTRIVHHVMLALNRLAADEGMKLAQAIGLDVDTVCKAVHGGEAQSYVIDRYLEKYRDMETGGQYRIAGIAIRMGYELGLPMIGPALFQQLYLPTKPAG